MVRTSRRRLLAGVTLAALSGCVGETGDEETTDPAVSPTETETPEETTTTPEADPDGDDESLPAPMVEVLDPIPESVDGAELVRFTTTAPVEGGDRNFNRLPEIGPLEQFELSPTAVDRMVVARYGGGERMLAVLVGSFDAGDPKIPDRRSDRSATHRADGLLVIGVDRSSGQAWSEGVTAAVDAVDAELALGSDSRLAIGHVSEAQYITLLPAYPPSDGDGLPSVDIEKMETAALSARRVDVSTLRITVAGVLEDDAEYDQAAFEQFVQNLGAGESAEPTIERDGRVALGRTDIEAPSEAVRDRTPEIRLGSEYDPDTGTVELVTDGGDKVSTDQLTLYVDGEPNEDIWESEQLSPNDSVTVEVDPFSVLSVVWSDPESDFETEVFSELIHEGATFENAFDAESQTLTLTYTGEASVEKTDMIRLEHQQADGNSRPSESETLTLSDRYDTLEPGTEITVDGVTFGDSVVVVVSHEYETDNVAGGSSETIHHFRARLPGHFHVDGDESRTLVYHGESRAASNYRLTIDGEEPETTLTEKYDTLEDEDTLEIGGEAGDEVLVEWVGGGGPATVYSERLKPQVSFELTRDTDGIKLVYRSSKRYDAESFAIGIDGQEPTARFADAYDTLEDGDSISLDLTVDSDVRVSWTEPDEPMKVGWHDMYELLRFELEGSALTFTGRGEWPADEFEVTADGNPVEAFSGTVTEGDSVTLDATTGAEIDVKWTEASSQEVIYSETIHPPFEFDIEYDETAQEVTITSRNDTEIDPSNLVVRLYGKPREEGLRPDVWAEAHDTVEKGDSITLSVASKVQAVVVNHSEWNVETGQRIGPAEGGEQ